MTQEAGAVRRAVVDGRTVIVVDRRPPLPPELSLLLNGGRDAAGRYHPPLRVVFREELRITGAARSCLDSSNGDASVDHRTKRWLEGFATCPDGVVRFLSLFACVDCGAVCVRDRSVDTLDGLVAKEVRRRDAVLGWYAGARPRERTYT